jgi:hypothetical protein
MHRLLLTTAAAAAIVATFLLIPNSATAIPLGGRDIPIALEQINPVEKVALCFYFDGWNGPGLYQCGYSRRYGEGFIRREREERRERFEDRERRERFEDRRERRERFEDRDRRERRFEDRRY